MLHTSADTDGFCILQLRGANEQRIRLMHVRFRGLHAFEGGMRSNAPENSALIIKDWLARTEGDTG